MMLYLILVRLSWAQVAAVVSVVADYVTLFLFARVAIPWLIRKIVEYILKIIEDIRNNRAK